MLICAQLYITPARWIDSLKGQINKQPEKAGPPRAATSFLTALSFFKGKIVASSSVPEYNHAGWIFGYRRRVNGVGLHTLEGGQACLMGHMGW